LPHESRDDHSVVTSLPRPDRIEQAEDNHGQSMLTMVGESKKLIDHLARCIRPSALIGSAEKHVIIFCERNACALTIDFGRTSNEDSARVAMSDAEHSLSAEDVCLDRMNRSLDNELYTDSRSSTSSFVMLARAK
jgi:hypothetical protein